MKYYETAMDKYLSETMRVNLHPKLEPVYDNIPNDLTKTGNLILYGPAGIGKYTQSLRLINKYSKSGLKYEKKMSIISNKITYWFKLSDVHFEVDMEMLGCNAKMLWFDIFNHILDILSTRPSVSGIILCKNFHSIHSELLEHFYSYMQKRVMSSTHITFILITEQLSFIPDNILNCSHVIRVPRPPKAAYTRCIQSPSDSIYIKKKYITQLCLKDIRNIKELKYIMTANSRKPPPTNASTTDLTISAPSTCSAIIAPKLTEYYAKVCDKLLHTIIHAETLSFLEFRKDIYDIFVFDLNISDCIWYIQLKLISDKYITIDKLPFLMIQTYTFFKYYNNNYRPIYHVEKYLFYIISIIHQIDVIA